MRERVWDEGKGLGCGRRRLSPGGRCHPRTRSGEEGPSLYTATAAKRGVWKGKWCLLEEQTCWVRGPFSRAAWRGAVRETVNGNPDSTSKLYLSDLEQLMYSNRLGEVCQKGVARSQSTSTYTVPTPSLQQ